MLKISKIIPVLALVSAAAFTGINAYADHDTFFDSYLKDGKMIVYAPQPTTEEDFWRISEMFPLDEDQVWELEEKYNLHGQLGRTLNLSNCNDDWTKCTFSYQVNRNNPYELLERHSEEFEIAYIYDPEVKTKVEDFLNGITLKDDGYEVKDMELVSYWLAQAIYWNTENPTGKEPMLPNFSSELKNAFANANLDFEVDVRCGFRGTLASGECGIGKVYYDGVYYGAADGNVEVIANHVFYVPSDTADDELVEALNARINNLFKNTAGINIEVVQEEGVLADILNDDEKDAYDEFVDDVDTEKPYYITFSTGEEGMGFGVPIVIKKDSSKLFMPSGLTSTDLMTGVNISSDINNLPGDTKAHATVLGSNLEEYTKALNTDKTYTYNLGLRSDSTNYDVTEEEGHTFKVIAPIPAELQDLELSAYFIGEDGKVEEYPAAVADETATFEVPHFSIYTIAEASDTSDTSTTVKIPDSGFFTKRADGATWVPISGAIIVLTGASLYLARKRRA